MAGNGIRPLAEDDLEQVAALYELVARSGLRTVPPKMVEFFRESFLKHPWVDPEIPSLVSEDREGRIVGFIGSHVRRFRFDGRPVRIGCGGQLVADPEARNQAVGAFLMRRYLAGPQDLTITDTATEVVRRIWETAGGRTDYTSCIGWLRVFRPWAFARAYLVRGERAGAVHAIGRPFSYVLDSLSIRVSSDRLRVKRPEGRSEELGSQTLVDQLPELSGSVRLYPDYDAGFLRWLFREMALTTSHGTLLRALVRDARGELLGWYVYYLKPGGISQVMQVAARSRFVGEVLDHLFFDAQAGGSAALQGRLEPRLLEPLSHRRVLLHPSGYLTLVDARNRDLLDAIAAGDAILTRMEGDWWMGHHLLSFEEGAAAE
jgi:GNAT superfamily N-acetyltransferase